MSLNDSENVRPAEDELDAVASLPLRKPSLDADARQWALFCHLSSLLGLMAAGMTFLGPLVCWLAKRDSSPYVDYHGKEALNFHLNILIYTLVLIALSVVTCGIGLVVTIPLLSAIGVYAIVMPILAGIKANEGEYYRYPLTFRLIK